MKIKKIFLVSHTNWDREWYLPYEGYRFRMVNVLDKLLQIFDSSPHFRFFTWDGHTIFIDDYLQIRPDKKGKLKRYIQQGRLQIGPWYTMPDEFLVSGESLIRNLLLGTTSAQRYGRVMRVGYLVDTFGHISQMPQILKGFGISEAIIWRGVGSEIDTLEFNWESPDGTSVLVTQLADHGGYGNIRTISLDKQEFITLIRNFRSRLSSHTDTGCLLLMNGEDYSEPQEHLSEVLEQLDRRINDIKLIQSTIPSYMETVKKTNPHLKTWRGELYSSEKATILQDVRSTRIAAKQKNREVEHMLEKWAEPMASWAWLLGQEYPQDFLTQAWKYLLQCHLHDPLCGSCIDEVEKAMEQRFYGAKILGKEILETSSQFICNCVDTNRLKNKGIPLIVFNPLNASRTDFVDTFVWYPDDVQALTVKDMDGNPVPCQIGEQEYKDIFSFKFTKDNVSQLRDRIRMIVYNIQGNIAKRLRIVGIKITDKLKAHKILEVFLYPARENLFIEITPERIIKEIESSIQQNSFNDFRLNVKVAKKIPILFLAERVPGSGYKVYLLEETSAITSFQHEVQYSPYCLENKWYKVVINKKDGTLNIEDKINGMVYKRCNQFFDEGDAGDTNSFCSPEQNLVVKQPQDSPKVSVVEKGPVRTTINIDMVLTLPRGLSRNRISRSRQKVDCPISTYLSLYSKIKRIDFRVHIENRAKDHRLRVHFPTPIRTNYSFSESNFDVVKRPIDIPRGKGWAEEPSGVYPHQGFVDVTDTKSGAALISRGIPEFQVMSGSKGVIIILTLLRCMGRLGRSDLTCRRGSGAPLKDIPRAQCLGKYCFQYSFIPHQGTWSSSLIHQRAREFEVPLKAHQTNFHSGSLPLEQNFIRIEPNYLVLSAVKQSEEGKNLIVRLYNPTNSKVEGELTLFFSFNKVKFVKLDETETQEQNLIKDTSGKVQVLIPAKSIMTLKFTLEE